MQTRYLPQNPSFQQIQNWPTIYKIDPLYDLTLLSTGVFQYEIYSTSPVFNHTYNNMISVQNLLQKGPHKHLYVIQKIISGENMPQLMTTINNNIIKQDIVRKYEYISPIDITNLIIPTTIMTLTLQRGKGVKVLVGLFIGSKRGIHEISLKIPKLSEKVGKENILASLKNSELETSISIGTHCPITRNRIKTPARSVHCQHFPCFDLDK